jgi:Na+/H+-dicarboxylate symporter
MNFKWPKINLSVQLALLFAGVLFFGNLIPLQVKSAIFACSLTLKEILLFVLPFIIFICLFSSMVANQGRALRFVLILFITVSVSNFLSIVAAFGAGYVGLAMIPSITSSSLNTVALEPLWHFSIPSLFPKNLSLFPGFELDANKTALFLGVILGISASFLKAPWAIRFGKRGNEVVNLFLQKGFVPLLPLFALGFIIQMEYEGILLHVVGGYAPIILIIFMTCLLYVGLMFAVVARFSLKNWLEFIKNVLPAGFLAFSTMSSLATMPLTLSAAEKNTKDPVMSRAIIPATVNIHMIGDSLAIPILAMAILMTFGYQLPNFNQCILFTGLFMLAKFAIPGVPCGSVFVMLPIFEQYLGFTGEMSAFITAIYILFDPIVTAANVLGNSALVIFLSKIMNSFAPQKIENTVVNEATL